MSSTEKHNHKFQEFFIIISRQTLFKMLVGIISDALPSALPLQGFSPQIWGFPTQSRVLGFFLGDLGFFLGFFKKARVFLGFCKISPKNTYFGVFFAGKQVLFGEKVWNELLFFQFLVR